MYTTDFKINYWFPNMQILFEQGYRSTSEKLVMLLLRLCKKKKTHTRICFITHKTLVVKSNRSFIIWVQEFDNCSAKKMTYPRVPDREAQVSFF